MKTIKLGLVAGRHEMPVDGYVLQEVPDVADINAIHKAVFKSLEDKLGDHIYITEYGPSINGVEDTAHYTCDIELHLYITGLTSVVLEVVRFCALNGVSLVAYHYDRESNDYIPQRIF